MLKLFVDVVFDTAFTTPLTAIFLLGAPVEVQTTLPLGEPVAELVKRTYIIVLFKTLDVGDKLKLLPKPELEEVVTSKPVGAVTKTLAVKPTPLNIKLCWIEALPTHELNVVKLFDVIIVGGY